MLDVSLRLDGVDLIFPRSTHTAITGPPACGSSTLLRIIAGEEQPERGTVRIGTRDVTKLPAGRRPLLYVTGELDVPGRWSVEHALVNAVRARTLDREDRLRELQLAAEKWQLDVNRRISTLSDSERARVHLARIELRKPAIVVADKLLRDAPHLADEFFRTLRVLGTTVISAPASPAELGLTDRVVVLDRGRVVQEGTAAQIFAAPRSEAAAIATGDVNIIPVIVQRPQGLIAARRVGRRRAVPGRRHSARPPRRVSGRETGRGVRPHLRNRGSDVRKRPMDRPRLPHRRPVVASRTAPHRESPQGTHSRVAIRPGRDHTPSGLSTGLAAVPCISTMSGGSDAT